MITEGKYNELLHYAAKLLSGRNLLVNKFDLVHSALARYENCTPAKVKSIFYEQLGYFNARHEKDKRIIRLTETKICRGCPSEGPLPVSMFYLCTDKKNNRVFLSTYCRNCNSQKSGAYFKLFKNDENYKQAHRKAGNRYYAKNKNDPAFKVKLKRNYKLRMRDPAYREVRRLRSENWRVKNGKGRKRPKSTLSSEERKKLTNRKKYEKRKNDPELKRKQNQMTRNWREKVKHTKEYKEKNRKRHKRWYQKNKKKAALRMREYRKNKKSTTQKNEK